MVDADGMGRAFPELQMNTFFIYGVKPAPGALCDEKGNVVVFNEVASATWLEKLARAEMGNHRASSPGAAVNKRVRSAVIGTAWRGYQRWYAG